MATHRGTHSNLWGNDKKKNHVKDMTCKKRHLDLQSAQETLAEIEERMKKARVKQV